MAQLSLVDQRLQARDFGALTESWMTALGHRRSPYPLSVAAGLGGGPAARFFGTTDRLGPRSGRLYGLSPLAAIRRVVAGQPVILQAAA